MWTDISQFEIPEYLKTAAYGSGRAARYTDIGEVCVVNSMFGKAKVRVIHPQKKRSLIWPLAALAAMGVAVALWLEQDMQKPPEPMRIIVRSVANEGTEQTNSETLQATPAIVSKATTPTVPIKPHRSPGLAAKTAVAEKPVTTQTAVPPVKNEPAISVPAAKPLIPGNPQTTPISAGAVQSSSTAAISQTAKPPAATQTAQPVVTKAAEPEIQKEKPAIVPATDPLPENGIKPVAPAMSGATPDQGITQP
jgi:hypothetical protein